MGQNAIPSDAPPGVSACESSEGRDMELIIGPRTYSTWSLRGWLILKHTGADFGVIDVRYDTKAQKAALRDLSPSGFVPVLRVDGARPQVRMGWGAVCAAPEVQGREAVKPFDGFQRFCSGSILPENR
jgi:hypothetical protein